MATVMYLVTSLLLLTSSSLAFNVDVKSATVYRDENDESHSFGQVVGQTEHWMLIGEPRDASRKGLGSLLACKPGKSNSCKKLPYHKAAHWKFTLVDDIDKFNIEKTNESASPNQPQMTCLTRSLSQKLFKILHDDDVGRCWVTSSYTNTVDGKGEVINALSAGLLKRSQRQMVIVDHESWPKEYSAFRVTRDKRGQVTAISTRLDDEKATHISLPSTLVDFDGDGEDDYVVGVPTGSSNDHGKIVILSKNLTVIGHIEDNEPFTEFGRAVTATDLNGDLQDEIVVGAPYPRSDGHTTGRVYIFYKDSSKGYSFAKHDVIDDYYDVEEGTFGSVVRGLGDTNRDGYNDLCVGAPRSSAANSTVSIFRGARNGIMTKPTQVIHGTDFDTPLPMFGQAISTGVDQDGNSYPDILVGAYGAAVYLRTSPVVGVLNLIMNIEQGHVYDGSHNCDGMDETERKCFNIVICAQKDEENSLPFIVSIVIDPMLHRAFFSKSKTNNMKKKVTLRKQRCFTVEAYVMEELIHDLTPINVIATIQLDSKTERKRMGGSRRLLTKMLPEEVTNSIPIYDCGLDGVCVTDLVLDASWMNLEPIAPESSELDLMVRVGNKQEAAYSVVVDIGLPDGVYFLSINSTETMSCNVMHELQHVHCSIRTIEEGAKVEFAAKFYIDQNQCNQTSLAFTVDVNSTSDEQQEHLFDNTLYLVWSDFSPCPTERATTQETMNVTLDGSMTNGSMTDGPYKLVNVTHYDGSMTNGSMTDDSYNSTTVTDVSSNEASLPLVTDVFRLNGRVEPNEIDESYDGPMNHTFSVEYIGNETFDSDLEMRISWPTKDKEGRVVMKMRQQPVIKNGHCDFTEHSCVRSSYHVDSTIADDKIEVISGSSPQDCNLVRCVMSDITPRKEFTVTILSSFNAKGYLQRRKDSGDDDEGIQSYWFLSQIFTYPSEPKGASLQLSRMTKLKVTTSSAMKTAAGIWTIALLVIMAHMSSLL